MRSPAAVIERADAAVFIAIENLVAGLPGDPKFAAQGRHLLALEQAGHKPEPLVHDVTLLPRHAPSCEGGKVSPMCAEYGVTYLSGRTQIRSRNLGLGLPSQSIIALRRPSISAWRTAWQRVRVATRVAGCF